MQRKALPRQGEESGFTLIELIVAMMVIGGVLLGLAVVQTSAMVTTAQSRQREQGTAIANQVMEQLRALPWNSLSKGLHSSYAASGADANVTSGRLHPAVEPGIDELLIISTDQGTDRAPLSGAGGSNVTTSRSPAAPGIVFTSRSYVTRAATGDEALGLTVITTWRANQTKDTKFVVLRSRAYSPKGGCGDASNRPFLGACQAVLSASGGANGPVVTITAAFGGDAGDPAVDATTPILPGSDTTIALMRLGQGGTSMTSQQATTVESRVLHAGGSLSAAGSTTAASSTGGVVLNNAASNDVGSDGAAPRDPADVTGSGSAASLTFGSPLLAMTVQPGSGASGNARASTVASCLAGITAGQACGTSQLSGSASSKVNLRVLATSYALVSIANPGTTSAFAGRFTSAPGAAAVGCTALTGAGCAAGGVSRTLGDVQLGGGPWPGVTGGLVKITSYADATRVERGASQPAATDVTSRSGAISYWTGSGYSLPLNLTATTNTTITVPQVETTTATGYTIRANARITVEPASRQISATDPTGCTGSGCAISTQSGLVSVAVQYRIRTPLNEIVSFTVSATLGGSTAQAAYKVAPNA